MNHKFSTMQSTRNRRHSRFHSIIFTLLIIGFVVGSNSFLFNVLPALASTGVDAGYRDFSYGSTVNSTPTGEKPESKLWWNDGFWWGYLFKDSDKAYHIYRLDLGTQNWIDTGVRGDTRTSTKADAMWDGQHLYIASHIFTTSGTATSSNWGKLFRYSYNSTFKTYSLDASFPVDITRGKSETLVIDKDSTGKLWATYVESGKVMINHSNTSDLDWGTPYVLPASSTSITVSSDDISSVIAFQGNKIGVLWSNQKTKKMYFAVHKDSDPDKTWQPEQTALPGPNNCTSGSTCADDHINLKSLQADSSGRVFAAIKTSLTASNAPSIMLLMRDLNGNWTNYVFGRCIDDHTRPIVLLDEEHGKIYMFATAPEVGGTIYYKSSDINNISFPIGLGTPFIKSSLDTTINNVTSTKQNVNSTTGLVVLASDKNSLYYLHNYMALGSGPTNQPPSVYAGPDLAVTLPNTASLNGNVTDDGLPNPPGKTTVAWSISSGPGSVTFSNPTSTSTSASFSVNGTYVLRLTASDSVLSAYDELTVTVQSQVNQAPVVNAGPDQTIFLPNSATLNGSVSDDGLPNPPGSTTITWSKVNGPGTVNFSSPNSATTTASFSAAGIYTVRLSAFDGALTSTNDAVITVSDQTPINQAPVVNAGPDLAVTLPNTASLNGSVTDDGLPNPPGATSLTWSIVSGPGTVAFSNPNSLSTSASFSAAGIYTVRLSAYDGALTSTDDAIVTVSDQGQSTTTLDIRVSSKTDDSEESATGVINMDRTKLTLVYFNDNQQVGMRFTGITIPQGATIVNAYIQFTAGYTNSGTTILNVQAQADDNASTFTANAFDISSRPKSNASVTWTPAPWLVVGEMGPDQQTPNLKSVIQEIISRPGWVSGNSLAIIVTGTGKRVAYSFNGVPASAALIHIEYSVP